MTDTVACIPPELAQEYKIKIVPAAIISYDGHEYIEGETISASQAYELIKKDPDKFVTSPPTPAQITDEYNKLSNEPGDIFFVTLSSQLSAFNKVAQLAAEVLHEKSPQTKVRIFDSKSCGAGEGLVVLAVAKAAQKGINLDQVANIAERVQQQTKSLMILDTLQYIYRTGRMSKEDAYKLAEAKIKPINKVSDEGTIEFVDSVTEQDVGLNRIIELIGQQSPTRALHFMVNHAAALDTANRFSEMLRQNFDSLSITISDYSPVMGYGAGPGAIFVAFHPDIDLPK